MRKLFLTVAALAAFGIALPVATTTSANAETIIIKKGHRDNGWHRGHNRGRVVVRDTRRHRGHGVVVREGRRNHGVGIVVR